MKRINYSKAVLVFLLAAIFLITQSCSKDAEDQELSQDAQLSQAELQVVLDTDQWTSAADEILTDLFRKSTFQTSGKFADEGCYEAIYTETGFTVVFGNCLLNGTDNVNGTLEVTYKAAEGGVASFTAIYNGFFVGAAELNGSRTFTLSESGDLGFTFTVMSEMSIALAEMTIMETGTKAIEFKFGDTLAQSTFGMSGSWMIINQGNTYSVSVDETLRGSLGCPYLTEGRMKISKNGLEISVEFGDGSCDQIITLIYPDGSMEEVSL